MDNTTNKTNTNNEVILENTDDNRKTFLRRGFKIVTLTDYSASNRTISNLFSSFLLSLYIAIFVGIILYVFYPTSSDKHKSSFVSWVSDHPCYSFIFLWMIIDILPIFVNFLQSYSRPRVQFWG